jgi:hypothetical protein
VRSDDPRSLATGIGNTIPVVCVPALALLTPLVVSGAVSTLVYSAAIKNERGLAASLKTVRASESAAYKGIWTVSVIYSHVNGIRRVRKRRAHALLGMGILCDAIVVDLSLMGCVTVQYVETQYRSCGLAHSLPSTTCGARKDGCLIHPFGLFGWFQFLSVGLFGLFLSYSLFQFSILISQIWNSEE